LGCAEPLLNGPAVLGAEEVPAPEDGDRGRRGQGCPAGWPTRPGQARGRRAAGREVARHRTDQQGRRRAAERAPRRGQDGRCHGARGRPEGARAQARREAGQPEEGWRPGETTGPLTPTDELRAVHGPGHQILTYGDVNSDGYE